MSVTKSVIKGAWWSSLFGSFVTKSVKRSSGFRTKIAVFVCSILLLLALVTPVIGAEVLRETFDTWNVNGWGFTESGNGDFKLNATAAYSGQYGAVFEILSDAGGARAEINMTVAQFSGNTSFTGFWYLLPSAGLDMTGAAGDIIVCQIDEIGVATFCTLEVSYNSTDAEYYWEFNNVETTVPVRLDTWAFVAVGYRNGTAGYMGAWVDDTVILNQTQDLSGFNLGDGFRYGAYASGDVYNKDFTIYMDNIVIAGEYPEADEPLNYTFWFIVTGAITMFLVTGFTLYGLKGRR